MPREAPAPGWYAVLSGKSEDLDDWRRSLNAPFDPVAMPLPNGETVLGSKDFPLEAESETIHGRAVSLISQLNGALSISSGADPVTFGGLIRVASDGTQNRIVFASASARARFRVHAAAVHIGKDGKPLPPAKPVPSPPQLWMMQAKDNDLLSDLLDQLGKADNWYDIYKTIEIAKAAVGGNERRLFSLMAPETRRCKHLFRTANFHRHARLKPVPDPISLEDGKPLLRWMIQQVLDHLRAKSAQL